jgi:hypothetical protein
MTYEEANEKLVEVVKQIQSETSIEVLNSVMQTTAFQVACLYDFLLKNRYHAENLAMAQKAQEEAQNKDVVTDVQPVQ